METEVSKHGLAIEITIFVWLHIGAAEGRGRRVIHLHLRHSLHQLIFIASYLQMIIITVEIVTNRSFFVR